MTHPYRSLAPLHAFPRANRSWSEIDAELLAAALSLALVIAGLLGRCDLTGTTIGALGLLASMTAIVSWLRSPA